MIPVFRHSHSEFWKSMGYRKLVTFNSGQLALEHLKTNQVTIDIINK